MMIKLFEEWVNEKYNYYKIDGKFYKTNHPEPWEHIHDIFGPVEYEKLDKKPLNAVEF